MSTDEAFQTLAKAYAIPEAALRAHTARIRSDEGTSVSNLALVSWLHEQAEKYERGMGHYGHKVRPETLAEVALYRLSANRLEQCNKAAFVLDHVDWLARRDGQTYRVTLMDAKLGESFKSAATESAMKPVAMA